MDKDTIIITLEGGLVQNVFGPTLGATVVVIDYDVDGADPDDLKLVGDDDAYIHCDAAQDHNSLHPNVRQAVESTLAEG